jgi:hypothetical protein
LAEVYARGDDYFVSSLSRTTDYLWLGGGPVIRVPRAAADRELYEAVRGALDRSKTGIDRPDDLSHLMDPLLAAAGVRSQRAFHRGARSIAIEEDDDGRIVLEPSRRRGNEFIHLRDQDITLDRPSPSELADSIRRAIEISE